MIKTTYFRLPSLLLLGTLALPLGRAALADVSYTQTTSTAFDAMMGGKSAGIQSQVAVKGGTMRTETVAMGNKTIIIVSRSAGTFTQIDPGNKIYVTGSGSHPVAPTPGMKNMGPSEVTVTVKKLTPEKIRGYLAPHFRVDMKMTLTSPQGPRNMNVGVEVWGSSTPSPSVGDSPADFASRLPANYAAMFGSKIKVNGDLKSMAGAFATIPLRTKMFMNNQPFGTTETTGISTNPVPDALFAIPAGYKSVSREVWNQKQQSAMMGRMGGMFKRR